MKPQAWRYLAYGQACFYLGLLICVSLRPAGLSVNQGISYYGVYSQTVLPYALALFGSGYFTIKLAEQLTWPVLRYSLAAIGLFAIGVLITPDTYSHLLNGLHMLSGILLFSLQLLLSGYLVFRLHYDLKAILLIATEFAAGVAAFIYLAPPHGLLLQSQVVFQMAFAGLLYYVLKRV